MREVFRKSAETVSNAMGTPWAFMLAVLTIVVWGVTGPIFKFSDTWQLVINTGTTIVTFLMVFLIQNTQNRETRSMQLKLDELILQLKSTRDEFVDVEDLPDQKLDELRDEFREKREEIDEVAEERGEGPSKTGGEGES